MNLQRFGCACWAQHKDTMQSALKCEMSSCFKLIVHAILPKNFVFLESFETIH